MESNNEEIKEKYFDYSKRALWLRAFVLGGHEGLVFTTLLITGVGTITRDIKLMLLTSFTGLVAGALKLAIAEFVSVYTQVDVIVFQTKRDIRMGRGRQIGQLPNPYQISLLALLAYVVWGTLPLLAAASIRDLRLRSSIAIAVASLSMFVLGILGAALGKTPFARSCAIKLIGGWIAISMSWGSKRFLDRYSKL
ncbi:VIT1 domain-containing protein [Cephalotus follicularis]|uniref:Vacuolar iron transporter n=1 Tax=Cephalotus follicularis TaxID=3775 RepID=A0A1Q3B8R4_CEPFO|nr:VIT1 domain-containing protein [Cephalotus follicularis]